MDVAGKLAARHDDRGRRATVCAPVSSLAWPARAPIAGWMDGLARRDCWKDNWEASGGKLCNEEEEEEAADGNKFTRR